MIIRNRLSRVLAILVSVSILLGIAGITNSALAATKPKSMTITATAKTVDIKGQVRVKVKSVKPSKASKAVYYKSSNKSVATVSSKGVVTGRKIGKVKIIVTSKSNKKLKKSIYIYVKDLKSTSISVSSRGRSLPVGYKSQVSATAKGSVGYYNQGVEWSSETPEIADVTSDGVVSAVAEGDATIVAKEKNGTRTQSCVVRVTPGFEDGQNNIRFGAFNWSVLEAKSDKALLITDKVIQNVRFNDRNSSVSWNSCELREYINNQFLNTYFSTEDRAKIVRNTNRTEDNLWYGTNGGGNVLDFFCPLSIEEVLKYYGDSGRFAAGKPSGAAVVSDKYNNARTCKKGSAASSWWLRSPGSEGYYAAYVGSDGKIYVGGSKTTTERGLRPTVWLSNPQ